MTPRISSTRGLVNAGISCALTLFASTTLAGPNWPASATIPVNLGGSLAGKYTDAAGKVFDGTGQTVVVIDGAFRPDHPAFMTAAGQSKILEEACFGAKPGALWPTLCDRTSAPISSMLSGVRTEYYFLSLPKSSYPSDSPVNACRATNSGTGQLGYCHHYHGTATAGIIAGQQTPRWESNVQTFYTGAAPGANVIVIKVGGGTGVDAPTQGWPIDSVVNALWYVNGVLAPRYKSRQPIAAVSISASGSSIAGDPPCGNAASDGARINAVAGELRAKGVAVVMAAGNSAVNGTGSWTCGNHVIPVGASGVLAASTPTDYTNISPRVALFAPVGHGNRSNLDYVLAPWDGFGSFYVWGTSFATPQVAAAFAVLRQKFGPTPSVDSLLSRMQSTGTKLTGPRAALAGPTSSVLNIRAALN
ncbi:S8 family serine peptidase [Acidovorax cavernicola]|nr:S8 family serine peptidase [Acidovorax cavernicola]